MRQRRFRRGFRRKTQTQWVASSNTWNNVINVPANTGVYVRELVGAAGAVASFDPPVIQRFKVLTIHGCIQCFQYGAGTANTVAGIHMGIARVQCLAGPTFNITYDPSLQTNAGIPWMWIRHWQIPEVTTATPNLNFAFEGKLPTGSDVWSRTKRIVRENEAICLFISVNTIGGAGAASGTYQVIPYLRALISKVA